MTRRKMWIPLVWVITLLLIFSLSGCGTNNGGGEDLQPRIGELEAENAALQSENQQLQEQVAALEEEVSQLQAQLDEPAAGINRAPNEGWEEYFPEAETTTLAGESTQAVRELLGRPPVLIRQVAVTPEASREIWVFLPFDQDPTGLYLFFKGDQLDSSRLDEFAGLYGSGLLDWEEFWLQ